MEGSFFFLWSACCDLYFDVIAGLLLFITLPALYDKYQDRVDEKLGIVHKLLLKRYDNILKRGTRKPAKEKKTQ